jgi:hypothetical protein
MKISWIETRRNKQKTMSSNKKMKKEKKRESGFLFAFALKANIALADVWLVGEELYFNIYNHSTDPLDHISWPTYIFIDIIFV